MESVVIVLIGLALILAILGGTLLVARRNKSRIPLEPPPDAPAIPKEIKEDGAGRQAELLDKLEGEAHVGGEEGGLEDVEEKLRRKAKKAGDVQAPPVEPGAPDPSSPTTTPEDPA